jgi:hypothetical protein
MIQYNEDIKVIHSIHDDMFHCQTIAKSLKSTRYRDIKKFFNSKTTKDYVTFLAIKFAGENLPQRKIVDERLNISNNLRGTYIHRRLINRFSCWCSNEYSYKIEEMLDNIFSKQISELNIKIVSQDNIIFDNSVRTNINNKKLKILKIDEEYVVSCNQHKTLGGEIVIEYKFPAGINIRQDIRNHFNKKGQTPKFTEEELPQLKEYIESLEPK